jgi:hypothetical protein
VPVTISIYPSFFSGGKCDRGQMRQKKKQSLIFYFKEELFIDNFPNDEPSAALQYLKPNPANMKLQL